LEDTELDASRELTQALRALNTNYRLAQTHFNRWVAATTEVESVLTSYKEGNVPLDTVLDAQRRRAQSQIAYYQALTEYNKTIALVHRRKGTTLDYCGVTFAEGPWTGKAYVDAEQHARRRAASREMNYAFTRPAVVSQGPRAAGQAPAIPPQSFLPESTPWEMSETVSEAGEAATILESYDPSLEDLGLQLEDYHSWGAQHVPSGPAKAASGSTTPALGTQQAQGQAQLRLPGERWSGEMTAPRVGSSVATGPIQQVAAVTVTPAGRPAADVPRPHSGQTYRPTRKTVAQIKER